MRSGTRGRVEIWAVAAVSAAMLLAACSASNNSVTRDAASVPAWDPVATYGSAGTSVMYKGTQYSNAWYAGPGACPVEADCPSQYEAGLWRADSGPSQPHEFASYDHAALKSSYPALPNCTTNDYGQAAVKAAIDDRIASGDLKSAAPTGGFAAADHQALYREYMLPCKPDLTQATPDNVKTVEKVLTKATWDEFSAKIAQGDLSMPKYKDANGTQQSWPIDPAFSAKAHSSFLSAVARYPYFCGEQGHFSTIVEACRNEIAGILAHAAQETGNGDVKQSFYWLREFGQVNGPQGFKDGCAAPFDCSASFARYYGRGPKQLTYYYNYAGFSAAYFNGNYQFLLSYPDLVAYDPDLYFQSAVWFAMSSQPPKPSIHDVIVGRYRPSAGCVKGTDCSGVQFDGQTGLKNPFGVTIEIVNGGPECRGSNAVQSRNRTQGFSTALGILGAQNTDAGALGCDFIAITEPSPSVSIFANDKLAQRVNTWVDLAGGTCKAQAIGGAAMVSITANGVVDACKS